MLVVTCDEILVVMQAFDASYRNDYKLRSDKPSAIVGRQPFLSINQVTETQLTQEGRVGIA